MLFEGVSPQAKQDWDELLARHPSMVEKAFLYAVTGDLSYGQPAINRARRVAQQMWQDTNDRDLRQKIETLALVYDWAYRAMSASDRQVIGNGILYGLKWQVDNNYIGPSVANFSGSHAHGHQCVATVAAVAILGEDFPLDENYGHTIEMLYEFSYRNLSEGWWPTYRRIGESGGGLVNELDLCRQLL